MAQCDPTQAFPPGFTLGTDGPAHPMTKEFWINHVGLIVRDLDASKRFYGDVLGMRHIFTIQYTDSFSLTYMVFSQGGKNGTGFQTAEELLRVKNNSGGLIKLLHFSKSAMEPVVPTEKTTTLANIGLVVPSLKEAEKWFDEHGVQIVKRGGVESMTGESEVAISFGVGFEATERTMQELEENHKCRHIRWRFIDSPYRYEQCLHFLPENIFECRQRRLRACWRCRRNRL